jgi:hypothetical protein
VKEAQGDQKNRKMNFHSNTGKKAKHFIQQT